MYQKIKDYMYLSRFIYSGSSLFFFAMGLLYIESSTDTNVISWDKAIISYFSIMILTWVVYAINNISDRDTDLLNCNDTKDSDFKKNPLLNGNISVKEALIFISILSILGISSMLYIYSLETILLCIIAFFITLFYSAPPLRLKAVPILDLLFLALSDIAIFIIGMSLANIDIHYFNYWLIILNIGVFSIAMTIPTVIQDIKPDESVGLRTTAVFFGEKILHIITLFTGIISIVLLALLLINNISIINKIIVSIFLIGSLSLVGEYIYYYFKEQRLVLKSNIGDLYGYGGHLVGLIALVIVIIN